METEARIEDGKTVGALISLVAFVVLLTFATGAWADWETRVFKSTGTNGHPAVIRIYNHLPCDSEKVLAHLNRLVKPVFIQQFKKSSGGR